MKMSNLEKYREIIRDVLLMQNMDMEKNAERGKTANWDSIGHINLITRLEDEFDVMFETEDILKFKTFENGIEILKSYGVEF